MILLRRNFATRPSACLSDDVLKSINNNEYKPKKHPGVVKVPSVSLPDKFIKAAQIVLKDYSLKTIISTAEKLNRYLKFRLPPIESKELNKVISKAQQDIFSTVENVVIRNEEDDKRIKQSISDRMNKLIKYRVYNWQSIKYDLKQSLIYLLARSAQEYAVLVKIMNEIAQRDPMFKPRSLFDFGSGLGMGTWAATCFWKNDLFEYFNVDVSKDMNDLAQVLLQGGSTTGKMELKGVFYRQFLSASRNTYDLVICAYTLMELPSSKARMEAILNLWNKTENYLIVVEHGNTAGFQIVNEIRDFILQLSEGSSKSYVFSPSPHDNICPKFASNKTKCCFPVKYKHLPFFHDKQISDELYSYVVLKKGERNQNLPNWPRLVEPTLIRSQHTICRMCCSDGNLNEIIFTGKKHGKPLYYCARKSQWGDRLPIDIENNGEVADSNCNLDVT